MAAALMFAVLPAASSVHADDGDPEIVIGTELLRKTANLDGAQTVFYGGIGWRVIAYDGKDGNGDPLVYTDGYGETQPLYPEDALVLFQNEAYGGRTTYATWGLAWDRGTFGGSIMEACLKNYYLEGDSHLFSTSEIAAIRPRTLPGGGRLQSETSSEIPYDLNKMPGGDVLNVLLWPLSRAEADAVCGRFRGGAWYWLRSPGSKGSLHVDHYNIYTLRDKGVLHEMDCEDWADVRPAFYLNQNDVVFLSAAYSGKSSGKVGPKALKKISENTDDEWCVTLQDDYHEDFRITNVQTMTCAESLTVEYSGAATGTNEYISAVITDPDGAVRYYGRIKQCLVDEAASGEVTVDLKGKYQAGDKLYVFSEQVNGDELTDYASALKEVRVPEIVHPLKKTEAKETSCEAPGNTEYWTCEVCGRFFGDEEAKQEIKENSWVIPQEEHHIVQVKEKKATLTEDGFYTTNCDKCWNHSDIYLTFHPQSFELGKTVYPYTGKKIRPKVTILDSFEGGPRPIPASQYTVTYQKNQNVGTATALITFRDHYEGSTSLTFTIEKAANPLKATGKKARVRFAKLKKRAQTLKVGKVIRFRKAGKGKMAYKLVSAKKGGKSFKKSFRINRKNGRVTVKRNLKKGTYIIKVQIKAAGTSNYLASKWQNVTFRIRVK